MDNMIYIAWDADSAGNKIGQAILRDDPVDVKDISEKIDLGNELWARWAKQYGGIRFSLGGDQGVYSIQEEAFANIEEMRRDYEFATGLTVTVGVGRSLSEAGKSLLVGKAKGKDMIVVYEPIVEQELENLRISLLQGTASEEEKKQGEAYLSPKADGMKKEETGHEKGVHTASHKDPKGGSSRMGNAVRSGHPATARVAANTNLETLKAMPKPKLTKSDDGAHSCPYCQTEVDQTVDDGCPYCAAHNPAEDGHPDDCQYCARMNHNPAEDGHADDCPYCAEMASHNPEEDGHPSDCPYCQQSAQDTGGDDQTVMASPPSTNVLPTTQDGEDYIGQDMARPSMDKPPAISKFPAGLGFPTDVESNENRKLDMVQNGKGIAGGESGSNVIAEGNTINPENVDTTDSILGEIDNIPPNEQALRNQVATSDDANMPTGTNMEGNVSRPEGYNQNTPSDMGLGEEHVPDITSVLQEGLDNHADSIQRERVLEMVGQALEGFKACKGIIEKAREQAPQLYASSIAMLKAMIEMAKLLGLDQEQQLDNAPLGSGAEQTATPGIQPQGDESSRWQQNGAGSNDPKTLGQ